MNKLKVYVVGGNHEYAKFLIKEYELCDSIKDSDLVIFTGGEDVYPAFYGEDTGSKTQFNEQRDYEESDMFNEASKYGKLIIGICRGAQFCTMKSGGRLIQHVSGHGIHGTHKILITNENREIDITSTHHQMMWPFNLNSDSYKIIAHTKERLSNTYLNGYDDERLLPDDFVEPEIVYYYNTNSLCIQGHPEYMPQSSQAVKFINMLIDELLEDASSIKVEEQKEEAPVFMNVDGIRINNLNNRIIFRQMADLNLRAHIGNDLNNFLDNEENLI